MNQGLWLFPILETRVPNKCKGCPNLENCIASSNIFECTESRYVVDVKVITTVT